MTFRTKVFLIFLITVVASVSLVAYGVTFYTQRAFEQMDLQRTHALEVQFGKEFAQRGDTIVQQVENITNADVTVRMVLDLARPNADASLYLHDANGAAQSHGLDFVEFCELRRHAGFFRAIFRACRLQDGLGCFDQELGLDGGVSEARRAAGRRGAFVDRGAHADRW